MRYFDHEIEKLIRSGVIEIEVSLSHSTSVGNLRLQLADLLDSQDDDIPRAVQKPIPIRETELEIEK